MNIFFNELSFEPLSANDYELTTKFKTMLALFNTMKNDFGTSHIFFPANYSELKVLDGKTLLAWISQSSPSQKNLILSVLKRPFTNDFVLQPERTISSYYFSDESLGMHARDCFGLSTAYITESFSISLCNHKVWESDYIAITEIFSQDMQERSVTVFNIYSTEQIQNQHIYDKLLSLTQLELITTQLEPDQKTIKLSGDHHGNDKLLHFAKKLLKSKYVISVVNNIAFKPSATKLVHKCNPDGTMEIVLHWEDEGFGMLVETTGRNLQETEAIGNLIMAEFDR